MKFVKLSGSSLFVCWGYDNDFMEISLRKRILLIAGMLILFLFTAATVMAQNHAPMSGGQGKMGSPFLIVGKLPHLTKLLMQQWDNHELALTAAQKEKLLVIRTRTIGGVKKLGPEIATLEKRVTEEIFAGKTPEDLASPVQSIGWLKSEATMLHLRCIYDTNKILTAPQKDFLQGL